MVYLVLAAVVIAADQITKMMTRSALVPGETIPVIGDFFTITYVQNKGAAFGMLSGQSKLLTLLPLAVIIAAMVFVLASKKTHPFVKAAVTLIAAGGAGNIIDRIQLGQVTDMISFSIFPPVFNVADIAVTVGCFLILIYVVFGERIEQAWKNRKKSAAGAAAMSGDVTAESGSEGDGIGS